jgi:hypothetical protein
MTPNQYKENVNINVIYETGSDLISSFDLKYNVADAGKDICKDGLGYPENIYLPNPSKPDEILNSDYLLDKTSDIDLFNYDTIDEAPLKKDTKSRDSFEDILSILDKEEKNNKTSLNEAKEDGLDNLVNLKTLEKLDNNIEITDTKDSQITKTKSSTIVRRKRPSLFDDDNN